MADSTQESLLRPEHEEQRTGGGPTQAYSCVHCLEFAVARSVNVILRHGLHWGRCRCGGACRAERRRPRQGCCGRRRRYDHLHPAGCVPTCLSQCHHHMFACAPSPALAGTPGCCTSKHAAQSVLPVCPPADASAEQAAPRRGHAGPGDADAAVRVCAAGLGAGAGPGGAVRRRHAVLGPPLHDADAEGGAAGRDWVQEQAAAYQLLRGQHSPDALQTQANILGMRSSLC
jgi:hypothetical protein